MLIVLFAFVGNNFDQTSTAKKSKRGSKKEKQASRDRGSRTRLTGVGLVQGSLARG